MTAMRGSRLQVGSAAWIAEERSSALQIVESEIEEFSFSAKNELDWLNEHMASIFDENENNIAETFKTPGKLRAKTPRTTRKPASQEARVPLSDVFSSPNTMSNQLSQNMNRAKSPQIRRDEIKDASKTVQSPSRLRNVVPPKRQASQNFTQDSGYGSQNVATSFGEVLSDTIVDSQSSDPAFPTLPSKTSIAVELSPERQADPKSPEKTTNEHQRTRVSIHARNDSGSTIAIDDESPRFLQTSPVMPPLQPTANGEATGDVPRSDVEPNASEEIMEEEHSPSEASSPVRPVVRKSSLNFASLPAREPLAAGKSNGNRASRVSHLDNTRKSYYDRPITEKTPGKFGFSENAELAEEEVASELPTKAVSVASQTKTEDLAANHHRTYTQRLQDQISMLGKAQSHGERESKSTSDSTGMRKALNSTAPIAQASKSPSSVPIQTIKSTPGAFPEDDEDWIERSPEPAAQTTSASPRPNLPKSHSADIMEGIHDAATNLTSEDAAMSPDRQTVHEAQGLSASLDRKSSPVPSTLESPTWRRDHFTLQKAATVTDLTLTGRSGTHTVDAPLKSPGGRSLRESPLKHAKNKLSSIIKSSRGLFASSAAVSAEGKSSVASPSSTKLGLYPAASAESLAQTVRSGAAESMDETRPVSRLASPTRPVAKRTRASAEREREEKKRDKETRRLEEQNDKLEKARAKEREKTRAVSKEQEQQQAQGKSAQVDIDMVDVAPPVHETPKPAQATPRRKPAQETRPVGTDVEMTEPPSSTIPQPASRSVGPPAAIPKREIKRPVRPVKETLAKTKQAPTVIRVNTGSQHSQFHVSGGAASSAGDLDQASAASQTQPPLSSSKGTKPSLHTKTSSQSLRPAAPVGRQKVLDSATKKKEQDEREAQRRREAKHEMERKRVATQEEQRRAEQQKRQEAERQKQKEREQSAQAEAKRQAQRQAAIEKAKQTRAPPPAVRPQLNSGLDSSHGSQTREQRPSTAAHDDGRPASRLEAGRLTSTMLPHGAKSTTKRALPATDDASRPGLSRSGPSYQGQDGKRRRTGEDMAENPPNIKGPPVRPSAGFKKDSVAKAGYASHYANAPQGATRDLFKATVTSQHHSQSKPTHPLDMAQISKGAIPFAPQGAGHASKTPVRTTALNGMKASAAKSAAKASPKFQNGEAIELPEIQTDDDEDEDDDDDAGGKGMIAAWADSPALRHALMYQETLDPSQIFGPPVALNMEEVFNKSKDKFSKFRSRTSSANWSGADRLTEEDIRKDMAAREKLRREGGWTYEMSKNLL